MVSELIKNIQSASKDWQDKVEGIKQQRKKQYHKHIPSFEGFSDKETELIIRHAYTNPKSEEAELVKSHNFSPEDIDKNLQAIHEVYNSKLLQARKELLSAQGQAINNADPRPTPTLEGITVYSSIFSVRPSNEEETEQAIAYFVDNIHPVNYTGTQYDVLRPATPVLGGGENLSYFSIQPY